MEIFVFMLLLFDLTIDLSTISGEISKYTNKTGYKFDKKKIPWKVFCACIKDKAVFFGGGGLG